MNYILLDESNRKKLVAGENILAFIVLLFIITLYFLPVIFSDQTYASRDIYNFFNPRRFFAAETIRSGTIPLWNPYLASESLSSFRCTIFG